jgi:hypothetical protein
MAWKKLVVSGSAISQLNNDANYLVSGDSGVELSGSFSGSFQGDGSNLTGVVASNANALTDGNGINDFSYDGSSSGVTISVQADGSTLTVGSGGVKVSDAGITATQLATSVAGDGLAGGAGTALSVNVDDSSIEINSDTLRVKASGITNAMLEGSIANDKLVNDDVTLGNTSVALGATAATVDGLTLTDVVATGSFSGSFAGTVDINLADLTDGNGIADFTYDGNSPATITVEADGGTLTVGSSGVKVSDGGIDTLQLADGGVTTAKISGSSITTAKIIDGQVTNAKLANDDITIGSTAIALGASATTIAGLTSVTSTTFVGDLTGNADSADTAVSASIAQIATEARSVSANSVALGTDTTGNYVATLGSGTGVTIGSNTGEGSTPTIAVNYGTSANTAAEGNTSVTFNGTSNEIELSANTFTTVGGGGTVTIGLPNDVTIGQDLTVSRDLVVSRNLTVAGTASFQHTTDLDVADRFIRLASGSNAAGDGGFVVQQASAGTGVVFGYDNASGAAGRWGVTSSFDATDNTMTPDAFMGLAIEGADNVPTNAPSVYQNKGNIFVGNTGDIWIYS